MTEHLSPAERRAACTHVMDLVTEKTRQGLPFVDVELALLGASGILTYPDAEHSYRGALHDLGVDAEAIEISVAAIRAGQHPPTSLPWALMNRYVKAIKDNREMKGDYMAQASGLAHAFREVLGMIGAPVSLCCSDNPHPVGGRPFPFEIRDDRTGLVVATAACIADGAWPSVTEVKIPKPARFYVFRPQTTEPEGQYEELGQALYLAEPWKGATLVMGRGRRPKIGDVVDVMATGEGGCWKLTAAGEAEQVKPWAIPGGEPVAPEVWSEIASYIDFECATVASVEGNLDESNVIVARIAVRRGRREALKLALKEQADDVRAVRTGKPIDWTAYLARRAFLFLNFNTMVQTIVGMREVPIQAAVTAAMLASDLAATPSEES